MFEWLEDLLDDWGLLILSVVIIALCVTLIVLYIIALASGQNVNADATQALTTQNNLRMLHIIR